MNSQSSSLKDFEVMEEIGKGAFGYVYKAKRIKDGEIYALKKVLMNKLKPKEKENSLNEIRILASVNHNNVISYKEAFYDNESSSICTIMEFAECGDLEKKISKCITTKTLMPEAEIVSLFVQIVLGLKALHDKKIMHRDIKAANIFLFTNDGVKIGDMNVSKVVKTGLVHTQTGTPYYASPEVWGDKPYDYKSDIWSLGCLLYEMTTLKAPFRGTTMKGVYEKVIKGVYAPIPNFFSPSLANLIHIMLQIKPHSRPSCDQITSYIHDKMKHLKLSVNLDQIKSGLILEDTRWNINQNLNRINSEKLLKTIKFPRKMNEINTLLPKSMYKKRRVNSAFNFPEKFLDTSHNLSIIGDTKKTEIIDNSINQINKTYLIKQDIPINDLSIIHLRQNKLLEKMLNDSENENNRTRIKSIDKSVISNKINEDPVLRVINKPIILKRNLINKIKSNINNLSNQNNLSVDTRPVNPVQKRILDMKRDYLPGMNYNVNMSSIDERINKLKEIQINESIFFPPKINASPIYNLNPVTTPQSISQLHIKYRPVSELIRHDRNNSANIKRIFNQDYKDKDPLFTNNNYQNIDKSKIEDEANKIIPKVASKNIINLFNHNNSKTNGNNKIRLATSPDNKNNSLNMMNLYPVKYQNQNDSYNFDLKNLNYNNTPNYHNNPNNKIFTRITPKIVNPITPTNLKNKEKLMLRDIILKN